MTLKEAAAILKEVTYKPGTNFKIYIQEDFIAIQITIMALDAEGEREELIPINLCERLSPEQMLCWNQHSFLTFIKALCMNIEYHEVNEWLKYKDKNVTDPHPEPMWLGELALKLD